MTDAFTTDTPSNGFKSWNSYRHFATRVRRQTRFIRTSEDEEFLREVVRTSTTRIRDVPVGTGLWRAQLGHDWRPFYQDDEYIDDLPAAYSPERMKPLQDRAAEGRANSKGIPVLYLSTHRKTAMSEVRPWLGSLVSCAHFKTTRALKIVDFSVYHHSRSTLYLSEPDHSKREEAVWTQIDRAFSEPTTPADNAADYVPTQVIAELIKNEGFDGIAYKSAFGKKGYNIVLFDPADAELTSCALFEAKSLKFRFEQSDNPYWVDANGVTKTTSVTDVRPLPPAENTDP